MKNYSCFKKENDELWQEFLNKKLPVFWIIGPTNCGKTNLTDLLSQCTKFHIIRASNLHFETYQNYDESYSSKDVLKLLKQEFKRTFRRAEGYIIDEFPKTLKDAKLFEKKICRVTVVIYLTLTLDALLCRRLVQQADIDLNKARVIHVKSTKLAKKIYRKYECKAIKLHSNYPPENTCRRLVENLEDEFGYKFLRPYINN